MGFAPKQVRKFRDNVEGYLFLSPAAILIGVFGVFPILFSVFVSLYQWRIRMGAFVGLKNYVTMFGSLWYAALIAAACGVLYVCMRLVRRGASAASRLRRGAARAGEAVAVVGFIALIVVIIARIYQVGDSDMLDSLRETIWYSLGTVPFQLVFGLLLATLLDRRFAGRQAFRVLFLLPYIVPTVAAAAVFERIFSLEGTSLANQILHALGQKPLQWLEEPRGVLALAFGIGAGHAHGALLPYLNSWLQGPSLSLVAVMFFNQWVYIGYYALIFANGLAQIPKQLYDAAEVDGAGAGTLFFKVTLPLLSPTTFFLTMIGVIGTFKAFTQIYVLRNPAAQGTVDTLSVSIFFTFFRKSLFGYAAAQSLFLFVLVLLLTLYQRRVMERRVHYGD